MLMSDSIKSSKRLADVNSKTGLTNLYLRGTSLVKYKVDRHKHYLLLFYYNARSWGIIALAHMC